MPTDPYAGLSTETRNRLDLIQSRIQSTRQDSLAHSAYSRNLQDQARAAEATAEQNLGHQLVREQELAGWDQIYGLTPDQNQRVRQLRRERDSFQESISRHRGLAAELKKRAQAADLQSLTLEETATTAELEYGRALLEAKQAQLTAIRDLQAQLDNAHARAQDALGQADPGLDSDAHFNAHTQAENEHGEGVPDSAAANSAARTSNSRPGPPAGRSGDLVRRPGEVDARPLVARRHERVHTDEQDGSRAESGPGAVAVTLAARDDSLGKTRRGKVPKAAETAIKVLRADLTNQVGQICKDHGVHPADVRALLGFNEQVVRESNNFNRYQSWCARPVVKPAGTNEAKDGGEGQADKEGEGTVEPDGEGGEEQADKEGEGTVEPDGEGGEEQADKEGEGVDESEAEPTKGRGAFMKKVKREWARLKSNQVDMTETMDAIREWEVEERRANRIDTVKQAMTEHERRARKLLLQAENSKGICSILIITHPHPLINGVIISTDDTEDLMRRSVLGGRTLDEIVALFDSYVTLNPPYSMRIPTSDKESEDEDDVADAENNGPPERASDAEMADEAAASSRSKRKRLSNADDDRPRTDKDCAKAGWNVRRYLLRAVENALQENKIKPTTSWLAASRTTPPKKQHGKQPEPRLPLKDFFTLLRSMRLEIHGWPTGAAKDLCDKDIKMSLQDDGFAIRRGSLKSGRHWRRDALYDLDSAVQAKTIKVVFVPRPDSDTDSDGSLFKEPDEPAAAAEASSLRDRASGSGAGSGSGYDSPMRPRPRRRRRDPDATPSGSEVD
ncbi:hypothetical protein A4X13_0g7142 [Tilletia indica]|uniref:Uncharacterized protein n=1 Tax=Tilletia indica TaxID=43049 RepID=A0A177TLN7_9BASI|nr:hypothetical protein A4X13_0g7142 [Tilletia indica]